MSILAISGSSSESSSNTRLLKAISAHFTGMNIHLAPNLLTLPLFGADLDHHPYPEAIVKWRKTVKESEAVIISTPAYLCNIPGVLKNALEWLSTPGALEGKPTLAITFTPHPPRGEEAMQSLLWSLGALNARIVVQCPLFQNEISIDGAGNLIENEYFEIIEEALSLLSS